MVKNAPVKSHVQMSSAMFNHASFAPIILALGAEPASTTFVNVVIITAVLGVKRQGRANPALLIPILRVVLLDWSTPMVLAVLRARYWTQTARVVAKPSMSVAFAVAVACF